MLVRADQPEDFYQRVEPAYFDLVGATEAAELTVVIAPGDYSDSPIHLFTLRAKAPLALTIRAESPENPPIWTNAGIQISGQTVQLEHLVIRQGLTGNSLLNLMADTDIVIDHCAILDSVRTAWPVGGQLAQISASGSAGQQVLIRNCWFLGNQQQSDADVLINCAGLPQHSFQEIRFENVVMVGNTFETLIVPGAAYELVFESCFIDADMPLARISYQGTETRLENCVIVCKTLDNLIRFSSDELSRAAVTLRNCQIYVESETDAPYQLIDTEVSLAPRQDRPSFEAALAACRAAAEKTITPDQVASFFVTP